MQLNRNLPNNSQWPLTNSHFPIDMGVLIAVVILTMVGLIMVYSVTLHLGTPFLQGQIIRICIGFCALIVASIIPYKKYQSRLKDVLLIGTILALVFTLIMGRKVADAKRWVLFFQPAEFAKYTIVIWLSGYFANIREKQKSSGTSQIKFNKLPSLPIFVVGITILLLLLQPAVGTSVILASSTLFVFFINGVKFKYLLLIIAVGVAIFSLSIFTIPYANKRFTAFRTTTTYQQLQSKIAIGSGGILGKGLGEGKQKLYFLPKLHTDFMFSAIGEEFGFIGCFIILFLFFVLFIRSIKIGIEINDDFGQLLVSGIIILIFQYLIVHVAVALSLIPTTGQPLPFISYGGSALVTNMYAVGIILNVSRFRRKKIDNENSFIYNRWHRRAYLPSSRSW